MASEYIRHLPTDNLYKFISISGLILLIISFVLPYKTLYEYTLKSNILKEEIRSIELEKAGDQSDLTKAIASGDPSKLNALINQINNMNKEAPKQFIADEKLRQERNRMRDEQISTLNNQVNQNNIIIDQINQNKFLLNSASVISFFIMFIGFLFWYLKTQRYQDEILKNEAKIHG